MSDLTTVEGVKALMASSKSYPEWDNNCIKVKAANNGWPVFWGEAILGSGLMMQVAASW